MEESPSEEQEIKQLRDQEDALEQFHSAVLRLKQQEEAEGKTAHFEGVDPSQLVDEDRGIYEKLQAGQLEREEFEAYRDAASSRDSERSRAEFAAYMGNILQI